MAERPLQAVIFDMDGLIIDSEILWQKAEIAVFRLVGVELTHEKCLETTGLRIDKVADYWFERQPWDEVNSLTRHDVAVKVVEEVEALIAKEGAALPGVYEAINLFMQLGVKIGLASSSPYSLIHSVLEKLDLSEFFEVICSATDEEHGKPDPAVYFTAARKLGVNPQSCLALEDSYNGLRAAVAAGMKTIAVPHEIEFEDEKFQISTLKLRTLEDLSLDMFHKLSLS